MKIVLSGAQCVGKSTILTMLEEIQRKGDFFPNAVIIKEVVRTLMKERPDLKINKDADHISQCAILEQHYRNCLKYPSLVTDRGAIDAFIYGTYSYLEHKFTLEEHLEHKRIFELSIPYYDIIFYLPPEIDIKYDGVRDIDPNYQQDIHKLFLSAFNTYHLPLVVELTGTVEERLTLMFNAIRNYLTHYPQKK